MLNLGYEFQMMEEVKVFGVWMMHVTKLMHLTGLGAESEPKVSDAYGD